MWGRGFGRGGASPDKMPLFYPQENRKTRFQSLGQVTDGDFGSTNHDEAISFDRGNEEPARVLNEDENRSAGVPGIHQDGQSPTGKKGHGFVQNLDGQLYFAFEFGGGTGLFGAISPDGPSPALRFGFENRRDGAESFHQSIRAVMDSASFDGGTLARAGGIVENKNRIVLVLDLLEGRELKFLFQRPELPCGTREKLMEAVYSVLAKSAGDFPDRAKFDEPDQSDHRDFQGRVSWTMRII